MPVHKVPGGWQWGNRGKVYPSKAAAVDQMQAAIANGFKGDNQGSKKPFPPNPSNKKHAQTTAIQNLMKKHGSSHGN